MEDTQSNRSDIVLCYLDFEGAFPSTDHRQLVRVLEFSGLPQDFTRLVSNLYSEASTELSTPCGHTPSVGIRKGTLQEDPLSPLLSDLMIKPFIRWIRASHKGYDIAPCGLKLASKWYVDDGTLSTNSVEDMIVLLDLVDKFSKWSGVHLNVSKCKINAFIYDRQAIPRKRDRDNALRARLAHVNMAGRPLAPLPKTNPSHGGI